MALHFDSFFCDYFYITDFIIVEISLPLYIRLCHLYGYFCFFHTRKKRNTGTADKF